MKLVVPLTIPCTRSIGVAESDSSSRRTTGTAPATAASNRSLTSCSRAVSNSSSPCCESSCLLALTTSFPACMARSRYSRAGSMPQIRLGEDLLEAAPAARENAADHRPHAVEALDLSGALVQEVEERRPDRPEAEQANVEALAGAGPRRARARRRGGARRRGPRPRFRLRGHRGRSGPRSSLAGPQRERRRRSRRSPAAW